MLDNMALISLLVAFVVAGFVWYGWGLARNIGAALRNRRRAKAAAAEGAAKPEP